MAERNTIDCPHCHWPLIVFDGLTSECVQCGGKVAYAVHRPQEAINSVEVLWLDFRDTVEAMVEALTGTDNPELQKAMFDAEGPKPSDFCRALREHRDNLLPLLQQLRAIHDALERGEEVIIAPGSIRHHEIRKAIAAAEGREIN